MLVVVEIGTVRPSGQASLLTKVPTLEQFAHQNAQPDLDLIHPGSVLGRVVEDELVCRIMQKSSTRGHRLQDAVLIQP